MSRLKHSVSYLLIAIISLMLTACGGGSNGTANNQTTQSGSVALLFTDAPGFAFDEVNVTITRIELISDDDAPVELFSGEETINLLDLQNHADLFSYTGNVPAKTYSKIRLYVSLVELVTKDMDGNVVETVTPKLPANGKIDLNPRGAFEVAPDQTLTLQIDIDAEKSIHIIKTGAGGYIFRPVVFIKRLINSLDGKVIRLAGEITDLDTQAQTFRLCRTPIVQQELVSDNNNGLVSTLIDDHDISKWCPLVHMSEATTLYGPDGEPLLLEDLEEGNHATVFGRFSLNDGEDRPTLTALTVLVGPAGTFAAYAGTVDSTVDDVTNRFDLDLADGQGISTTNPVPVQLQPGALILSKYGHLLDASALKIGQAVRVIGILMLSDSEPDFIKATMVFVDIDSDNIKLSGTISAITESLDGFTLMSDSVGDVCVALNSDTSIFLISEEGGGYSSDEIEAADLVEGQQTDVYGQYNLEGCLVADTILAEAI